MYVVKPLFRIFLLAYFLGFGKATISTPDIFESMPSEEVERFVNRRLFLGGEYELMRFWERLVANSDQDVGEVLRNSFSNPKLWAIWFQLHSSLRDSIVLQVFPFLAGNSGETLHCTDAYNLCLADNNCRSKFYYFQKSCFDQNYSLEEWIAEANFRLDLLVPRVRIRRKTPRHFRKFARSRKIRKGRRRRTRKTKYKQRFASLLSLKKFRQVLNEATVDLHYWMGRFWPNVYTRSLSKEHQCSPRCHDALLLLNKTVYAGLLAKCSCKAKNRGQNQSQMPFAWDEKMCKRQHAKAIECRPRLFKPTKTVIGCTASRLKCDNDPKCKTAKENFLLECSQVISNVSCTDSCREAKDRLSAASRHFGTCVCDGSEMRGCRKIRENLQRLCSSNRVNSSTIKTDQIKNISKRTTRSILNCNSGAYAIKSNFYFLTEIVFVIDFLFYSVFFT